MIFKGQVINPGFHGSCHNLPGISGLVGHLGGKRAPGCLGYIGDEILL